MLRSQNGFLCISDRADDALTVVTSSKSKHQFVVRKFCREPFQALVNMLDTIEPASEAGWDGGWSFRRIVGSTSFSNHASGTAIDWNASQHPQGTGQRGWTTDQVRVIRKFLATQDGWCFKWGADFHHRSDSMHFEMRDKWMWEHVYRHHWHG